MRARVAATLGEVFWSDLRAHAARDALIVVSPALDLLDAAVAVATDHAAQVERWIHEQSLRKPSADELAQWSAAPAMSFTCLVVAPFVLIQPARPITTLAN